MIALFPEPPRITISQPDLAGGSRNGLLIGMIKADPATGSSLVGIVCCEDGSITMLGVRAFSIDYRYQAQTDRWVDKDDPDTDQEG